MVIVVAFTCFRLLQRSDKLQASRNAKLVVIPDDNLIHFEASKSDSIEKYTSKINQLVDSYSRDNPEIVYCDEEYPPPEKSCDFNIKTLGSCTRENGYGYSKGSPCVFFKIRKNREWLPKYYNASVDSELPENMPQSVKNRITISKRRAVWFSCEGVNPADAENIGPVSFFPRASYPFYYFPWKGQENYLEPVIAAHFERPQTGIVISIKCTIWTQDQQESVEFDLLID